MWVEGRVLDTHGSPLSDVVVETWETDEYVTVCNPISIIPLTSLLRLYFRTETDSMTRNTRTERIQTAVDASGQARTADSRTAQSSPLLTPSPVMCVFFTSFMSTK